MEREDEEWEPGFDPGPDAEDDEDTDGECEHCGEIDVRLFEGQYGDMICAGCAAMEAEFEAEDRAVRHAENGYGYSGGWSGYEPPYIGD